MEPTRILDHQDLGRTTSANGTPRPPHLLGLALEVNPHMVIGSRLCRGRQGSGSVGAVPVVDRDRHRPRFGMGCYLTRISASWRRYLALSSEAGLPGFVAVRRR